MPYKVTNFLFITSPEIKYVFLYDIPGSISAPAELTNIIKKLPEQIDQSDVLNQVYNLADLSGLNYANEYHVRFIGYSLAPDVFQPGDKVDVLLNNAEFRKVNYRDISILNIMPEGNPQVGKLQFYKVDKNRKIVTDNAETFYLGETSLIAAMLVDKYFNYACPMESVFERLHYATSIYEGRTNQLKKGASSDKCTKTYVSALSSLGIISTESEIRFMSLSDVDGLRNIFISAFNDRQLEDLNDQAILFSCPEIF